MVTERREMRAGIEARLGASRRDSTSWSASCQAVLAIHAILARTARAVVVECSALRGEWITGRESEVEGSRIGGCGEGVGVE